MAVNLSPYGGVGAQFLDNSGNVLTGGKIYTYSAGTTTPQATYTTSAGNIPHSNPIILDAAGRVSSGGEIWLTDGLSYKFILRDANDVLIATYDNISGINSNFVAFTNQQEIQTATAGQTIFNLTTMTYQPGTNSLSVFVDGVNQYGPGAQYAYLETDSDTVTFVNGLHVGAEVKFTTSQLNSSGLQSNAFQVSYTPPFTGSVGTNVGAKLAQTVSVKDFGATGNAVTDDTLAFTNAIASGAGCITIPDGTYKITSKLTLGIGQTLVGTNFNKVFLVHTFNGDMFEMLEKSQAFNITFTGQGSTYTGQGLVMTSTNGRQYVENCSFLDFEGAAIYFEKTAGSQSCFVNVRGTRTGAVYPSTDYCVVVEDGGFVATAVPRTFYNYMSSGFTAFSFGSSNNFYIHGGFIGDCEFSTDSRGVSFSGARIAYLGTFDIKGANHAFSACNFGGVAPQTVITTGSAITIEGCTFNNPPVLDSAAFGQNLISCVAVTYTPTITTDGTAPSLGNGTISGTVFRSGALVTVSIELTLGSTTTLGTGEIRFSLPTFYPNRNGLSTVTGTAVINKSPTLYTALTSCISVAQYVRMISCTNSGVITATSPVTWAAGDIFRLQFSYLS